MGEEPAALPSEEGNEPATEAPGAGFESAPLATEAPIVEIATEPPITQAAAACPVITDQIVAMATFESDEEELLDEQVYLVTYYVSGNEIGDPYYETVSADLKDDQEDTDRHQQIWDYFTEIIPVDARGVLAEYSIVTDGRDGTLAAVSQTYDDPALWALEVDIADSDDYYNLTFTLIHEFGHLLTLGPEQVPPSLAVFNNPDDEDIYFAEASKCPRYFPGEGCANADSYVNAFYDAFWTDIHDEWSDINLEEDEDAYYARLDEFYYNYEDQFLTSYAVTNPEEDIAESWTFFVVAPKPAGNTIAEEKILFFYQYPELVQLREEILSGVCAFFP